MSFSDKFALVIGLFSSLSSHIGSEYKMSKCEQFFSFLVRPRSCLKTSHFFHQFFRGFFTNPALQKLFFARYKKNKLKKAPDYTKVREFYLNPGYRKCKNPKDFFQFKCLIYTLEYRKFQKCSKSWHMFLCLEGMGTYLGKNGHSENFHILPRLNSGLQITQFHPGSVSFLMYRHVVNIRGAILHVTEQKLVF